MAKKKKDEEQDSVVLDDLSDFFKKELSSADISDVEEFISTGSTLLDYAIANRPNGGIPVGRITEICGNEATGKSLIAYHVLANTQKMGGVAVYIDTERAANKDFMQRMGIDCKKLIYENFSCIEEVFEYIEKIVTMTRLKLPDRNRPVVIVWDSVASTPAKSAIEAAYDEQRMAEEARVMSKCLRKAGEMLDEGGVTLLCVNQLRQKIGIMFGDPDITPHGKALPFYASLRIKMSGTKKIVDKQTERVVGIAASAKVFKNKVGPNWREANFPLMYDFGVEDEVSLLDYLSDTGAVKTAGAWKSLEVDGQERKFQSTDWKSLMRDPKFKQTVLDHVKKSMVIEFKRDMDTIKVDADSILEVEQLKRDMEDR